MVGVDTARVMELYAADVLGGDGHVGSGYRVTEEAVLTAAHVVAGGPLPRLYRPCAISSSNCAP